MSDDLKSELKAIAARNKALQEERRAEEMQSMDEGERQEREEKRLYDNAVVNGIQISASTIRSLGGGFYDESDFYLCVPSNRLNINVPGRHGTQKGILEFASRDGELQIQAMRNGFTVKEESHDLPSATPESVEKIILTFVRELMNA